MNAAVLGATGRSGVPLVQMLIGRGHDVKALLRSPAKAHLLPPEVEIIAGHANDPAALARLVANANTVVDLIGPSRQQPVIREATTKALLSALGSVPRRVVMVTGAGVRIPADEPRLIDRMIVALLRQLQEKVLDDAERAVRLLTGSPHQWTIVRVPRLVPDRPGRAPRIVSSVNRGSGTRVGREDLAAALVEIIEDTNWARGYPVVCW